MLVCTVHSMTSDYTGLLNTIDYILLDLDRHTNDTRGYNTVNLIHHPGGILTDRGDMVRQRIKKT